LLVENFSWALNRKLKGATQRKLNNDLQAGPKMSFRFEVPYKLLLRPQFVTVKTA